MAELEIAGGRCSRRGSRPQAETGQDAGDFRKRCSGSVSHAARSDRRIRIADSPDRAWSRASAIPQ